MPRETAPAAPSRSYNSSRRLQQAAATRRDVLATAVELFQAHGWAGTTLAAIAEHAGVAVETVYKGFGSKKALLRAAMEVAVVGDAEPVPFVERPEFASLAEGSRDERIARATEIVASIHERSAGIWQAMLEAASSDAEVDGWRGELERARRTDVGRSAELIVGGPVDDQTTTSLWILYGPEAYLKLLGDAGMTRREYLDFLAEATRRILAAP